MLWSRVEENEASRGRRAEVVLFSGAEVVERPCSAGEGSTIDSMMKEMLPNWAREI